MFTYTPAGLVEQKWDYPLAASFNTYDNEGRTVSTQYPFGGPSFTYTYDAMGRPIGLRDNQPTPVDWVKDVAYNAAGQITSMSYARDPNGSSYYTETRQYNVLQQLTRLTVPGVMDHEYRFSATQNDGRITQRKDWVSGEEITYQYDTLNRLISAQTTGPEWGQSFGYDGFGNLLSQTVTKGSAPSLNVTVDPATNRITNPGMSYDANGNLTAMPGLTMAYDTDNRMITTSGNFSYVYDPAGQRVRKNSEVFFYGVEGNLLATSAGGYNVYFGKKLIYNSAAVVTDRLGSVVEKDPYTVSRYFPYGDEGWTTAQDRPKFATYYRDSGTALDYAQQRYYASTLGRFTSPDPYQASGGPADPQSWNRYAYVEGDPVNANDPSGLFLVMFDRWDDVWYGGGGGAPWDPCNYGSSYLRLPGGACWIPLLFFVDQAAPGRVNHVRTPKFLQIDEDCYRVPAKGPVTREITYKLFDDSPIPMFYSHAVVWEHLTGDLPVSGTTSGGEKTPGWFYDTQSVLIGKDPQIGRQTFSAFTDAGLDIPVFVRGFGQDRIDALDIKKTSGVVYINGNAGGEVDPATGRLIPGTYLPCDQPTKRGLPGRLPRSSQ